MNTEEIERAICQDPSAETIFCGVFARDKLPQTVKYPTAMVWNTDPADEPGEHWVAVYINEDGVGEYFDSYGIQPPPCFKKYLQRQCTHWVWNQIPLQDVWTSACGHFCVFYVIHCCRGLSMETITDYLFRIEHNDQFVMECVTALL